MPIPRFALFRWAFMGEARRFGKGLPIPVRIAAENPD